MDSFYYDILNIGHNSLNLEHELSSIIWEIRSQYSVEEFEGLCKVCSILLSEKLHQRGYEFVVLNTKSLLGGYEHEAVLVRGMVQNKLEYYLVDMTFSQFMDQGGILREFFRDYPVSVLSNLTEDSNKFCSLLLKQGFARVSPSLLTAYFISFSQDKVPFQIENLDTFFLKERIRKV